MQSDLNTSFNAPDHAKHLTMRIGRGEFQQVSPAGDAPRIDQHARRIFLETIAEVAPHVLAELAKLLPRYQDAPPLLDRIEALVKDEMGEVEYETDQGMVSFEPEPEADWIFEIALQTSEPPPQYIGNWQQLEPLRRAIHKWADNHHLNADWLRATALVTLGLWHSRGLPERLSWDYPFVTAYQGVPQKFSFQPRGWAPQAETRAEAAARLRTEFKQYLGKYLDDVERKHEASPGWKRTPEKRSRAATDHFEWLVRYQVCGWSKSKIARERHAGYDTVVEALDKTADLIGLPITPGESGRPPKSKSGECS